MVSKKHWKKSIDEFLGLLNEVNDVKNIEISGVFFKVLPGVFSPILSSDTAWFAENVVPLTKNKNFLEIGSGTGIIACLASINGAASVTATDINPTAVKNILLNSQIHSLNISIREGSVFDPIDNSELFDVIFWNHPFYFLDTTDFDNSMLEASVFDLNYQYLREFFRKGRHHLTNKGQLILGTSNVARINLIKKIAKEEGLTIKLLNKTDVPVYRNKRIKMDVRLYSFKI